MYYKVALTIYEQQNHLRYIAIANTDIGDVYLKTSQYSLAASAFRHSLHLAERIGHVALMCLGHGNLGELDLRFGNLQEAEARLRKSIALAEGINDRANASLWYPYLATVEAEQGRLSEASATLYRALKLSRASHFLPYIGATLVAVGNLRMAQAVASRCSEGSTGPDVALILKRARKTLQHALGRSGLFAEARTEGRLALAQVNWLLGDLDESRSGAKLGLEEAHQSELMRLVACAERILGGILATQYQSIEAAQHFDQALKIFRKCGMRLEEARTLQSYGEMLVRGDDQRGMKYLHEARQIFMDCHAVLAVKLVERVLEQHGTTV